MDWVAHYYLRAIAYAIRYWPATVTAIAGITIYHFVGGFFVGVIAWALLAAGIIYTIKFLPPAPRVQATAGPATGEQHSAASDSNAAPGGLQGVDYYPRQRPDPGAFEGVIGLDNAKETVVDMLDVALDKKRYKEYGVTPPRGLLMHGPPGTGKTYFTRAAAQRLGCSFYVANASNLVGKWVGTTEENINALFDHAQRHTPAVIFFDEFDAIGQERSGRSLNTPSDLAINTLLTRLDGFGGGDGVFVMAATNRLDTLDPALIRPGRFDQKVEISLPDANARAKLFALFMQDRPNQLSEDDYKTLAGYSGGYSPAEIQAAVNQAALAAAKNSTLITRQEIQDSLTEIKGRGAQAQARTVDEVWAEIDNLVGLAPVKQFLKEIEATAAANAARKEKGLPVLSQSLHTCFTGNPGTGKTTVARLMGELLAAVGALPGGQLVEVDRGGLVGRYIGETAQKTAGVIKRAEGGVLFVDEAYALARGKGRGHDFGAEALDTLVKAMEDQRDNMIIILAGYTKEMQDLFNLNPGLKSRVAFTCEFPDYTPKELMQIAQLEAGRRGVALDAGAGDKLISYFRSVDVGTAGNGRLARKVIEDGIRKAILNGRDGSIAAKDLDL